MEDGCYRFKQFIQSVSISLIRVIRVLFDLVVPIRLRAIKKYK